MAKTVQDLINETRGLLLSDLREETNVLSGAITNSQTTITTKYALGSVRPSAIIQIDLELLFVLDATPGGTTVTVSRGWLGTTAATHADQAIVTINPRFPDAFLVKMFNEELDSLSSPEKGLFQVPTPITPTYVPVIVGYDMTGITDPSTVIDLYEVRAKDYGPFKQWPLIPPSKFALQRNADTTVFPSGLALELYEAGYPGNPIRVKFKQTFSSTLAAYTDVVTTVSGIHSQAVDILVYGAALRMMGFREAKRSFTETQTDPRRAEEVPVGASLTALRELRTQYTMRVQEESVRLSRMYPPVRR